MIIKTESDLHVDIYYEYGLQYFPKLEGVDVYILAGDVAQGLESYKYCSELLNRNPNLQIIHVSGNHEYYDNRMEKLDESLKNLSRENERYHYLQNDSVVINGIRFIGATMWTDFDGCDPVKVRRAWNSMNDYQCIKYILGHHKHKLTPYRVASLFRNSRDYIFKTLKYSEEKCIVVTHHCPLRTSSGDLSSAYEVNLDKELNALINLPLYWFSGHRHQPETRVIDYDYGKVTFIENSKGYPKEENGFNPDLIIEV